MTIFLAIPCYNCASQLPRVLSKLAIHKELLDQIDFFYVIDNRSIDKTVENALGIIRKESNLTSKCKVVINRQNYGLGGSYKLIVKKAEEVEADYLIWLHGDDQVAIDDLSTLINLIKNESNVDAFFGARFMPGSQLNNYSFSREWGNRALNWIGSLITGKKIYELGSGLNAYKLKSLPLKSIPSWPDHIAFDMYLTLYFLEEGRKACFFPIEWSSSDQKSNANNLKVTWQILSIMGAWKFGLLKEDQVSGIEERAFEEAR